MDALTILLLTLMGVFLLLLVLGLVFFRRRIVVTVEGFSWERQMFLEKYVWVEESSLSGYPLGSRNQHSTIETYYINTVVGHNTSTTQNPNGTTSTTSTPIYRMVPHTRRKYLYEIQRWMASRQLVSSEKKRKPYWPSYALDERVSERVCNRSEKYLVHFRSAKGKPFQRELPEDAWAHLDEKETYVLKTTVFGRIMRVEPDLDLPASGKAQPVEMKGTITQ